MRSILTLLAVCVSAYGLIVVLLASMQHKLVYQPLRDLAATPADIGLEFKDVTIPVSGNDEIHGWFVPSPVARATVLFFHGNAGNISHRLATLELFHELGLQTMIIDYRGYGRSTGSPSEAATHEDALATWQWLTEHNKIDPQTLIVYGRSLGGGIASALVAQRPAGALVLDSTFTSMRQIAKDHYWWLPVDLALRIHYDTAQRLGKISTNVVIFHSRDDEIVPFHHGERLFEVAREPKSLIPLQGSHNTLVSNNRPLYAKHLKQLIASVTQDR